MDTSQANKYKEYCKLGGKCKHCTYLLTVVTKQKCKWNYYKIFQEYERLKSEPIPMCSAGPINDANCEFVFVLTNNIYKYRQIFSETIYLVFYK